MIGHHDDRADGGNALQRRRVVADIDREAADGRGEEAFASHGIATVGEVQAAQVALPRRGLDEPNEAALDGPHRVIGVAEIRFAHALFE